MTVARQPDLTDTLLVAQDYFERQGIHDCEHEMALSPEMIAVAGKGLMWLGRMSEFSGRPFRIVERPPVVPGVPAELLTTGGGEFVRQVFYDGSWLRSFLALHYPEALVCDGYA